MKSGKISNIILIGIIVFITLIMAVDQVKLAGASAASSAGVHASVSGSSSSSGSSTSGGTSSSGGSSSGGSSSAASGSSSSGTSGSSGSSSSGGGSAAGSGGSSGSSTGTDSGSSSGAGDYSRSSSGSSSVSSSASASSANTQTSQNSGANSQSSDSPATSNCAGTSTTDSASGAGALSAGSSEGPAEVVPTQTDPLQTDLVIPDDLTNSTEQIQDPELLNITTQKVYTNETVSNESNSCKPGQATPETVPQELQTDASNFRSALAISGDAAVKVSVVKQLAGVKQADLQSYTNIVSITQASVAEPEAKQELVSELVNMDPQFVQHFSSSSPHVDQQVRDYLKSVDQPDSVSVNLDEQKINDAVNGNKDFDQLISEIW